MEFSPSVISLLGFWLVSLYKKTYNIRTVECTIAPTSAAGLKAITDTFHLLLLLPILDSSQSVVSLMVLVATLVGPNTPNP